MKCILRIIVKMPTIVGISTFISSINFRISRINKTFENFIAKTVFLLYTLDFTSSYISSSIELSMKEKFINSRPEPKSHELAQMICC